MLEELSIRNYALIDNLSISFERGLTILTGETGAGKSIIVGALGFLLGAKADLTVIRGGADEASVQALISIRPNNTDALRWLSAHDIECEDGRISVRRTIKGNGRGSVWIGGAAVGRPELAEFMAFLFDMHGQHAHQSLLSKESHRRALDRFAGLEGEAADFNRVFVELAEKRKNLENSLVSRQEREARIELLNFSIDEIDKARLKPGESRDLEAESARLASFEKLSGVVETASLTLFDDELSVLSLSRKAKNALDAACAVDSSLSALAQRLGALFYEAEDLSSELRSYRDGLSFDSARLEEVEERLALIQRLKKKYGKKGSDEDLILNYRNDAASEIEALSASDENREKQKAAIADLEKELVSRAGSLSARRKAASERLSQNISRILKELSMANAVFSVSLAPKGPLAGGMEKPSLVCGPYGADEIEFLFSANKGEAERELRFIASGGELSRVMLAIKTALVGQESGGEEAPPSADSAETLIFDEIDTGIGGETAITVGEYLQKIGGLKQIFCVTHLAVIACRADNHLKVEKKESADRTITAITVLDRASRRNEIARMLSGERGGTALAHAGELLAKYGGRLC